MPVIMYNEFMERISRKNPDFKHAYSMFASTWSFTIEKITIHIKITAKENKECVPSMKKMFSIFSLKIGRIL